MSDPNGQTPTAALRSGTWTTEEEKYAKYLIQGFKEGSLENIPSGTSLRGFLAKELRCKEKRISKKMECTNYHGRFQFKAKEYPEEELREKWTTGRELKKAFEDSIERLDIARKRPIQFTFKGSVRGKPHMKNDPAATASSRRDEIAPVRPSVVSPVLNSPSKQERQTVPSLDNRDAVTPTMTALQAFTRPAAVTNSLEDRNRVLLLLSLLSSARQPAPSSTLAPLSLAALSPQLTSTSLQPPPPPRQQLTGALGQLQGLAAALGQLQQTQAQVALLEAVVGLANDGLQAGRAPASAAAPLVDNHPLTQATLNALRARLTVLGEEPARKRPRFS